MSGSAVPEIQSRWARQQYGVRQMVGSIDAIEAAPGAASSRTLLAHTPISERVTRRSR